jgi:hypothetical protein
MHGFFRAPENTDNAIKNKKGRREGRPSAISG